MSIVNGQRWNVRSSDLSVGVVKSGWDYDLSVLGSVAGLQAQIDVLDGRMDAAESNITSLENQFQDLSTLDISDVAIGIDWRTFNTTTLTAGSHNFGGLSLVAQAPPDGTFRVLNGSGIEFVAGATNTTFAAGGGTCALFYWTLDELFTQLGIDSSRSIVIEHYFSTLTFPTPNVSPAGVVVASWGIAGTPSNSGARQRGVRRGNLAGSQALSGITDAAAGTAYTTAPASTSNVLAIGISHGGVTSALAGVWGGAFVSSPLTMEVATPPGPSANPTTVKDRNNRMTVAFPTGNTAADMVAVLQQTRIRVAA
jgi:acyl-coenzyme A thioesterase PaaI-like protein